MPTTANYNLQTTDSNTEYFKDWWRAQNLATSSNITKIDTALGEKAAQSVAVSATLSSSAWTGSSSPYSQVVSVPITSNQNGMASLSPDATVEERIAAREAIMYVSSQAAGTLTINADGIVPLVDIPIQIIILG